MKKKEEEKIEKSFQKSAQESSDLHPLSSKLSSGPKTHAPRRLNSPTPTYPAGNPTDSSNQSPFATCPTPSLPSDLPNLEDKVPIEEWGNDSLGSGTRPKRVIRKPKRLDEYVCVLDGSAQ